MASSVLSGCAASAGLPTPVAAAALSAASVELGVCCAGGVAGVCAVVGVVFLTMMRAGLPTAVAPAGIGLMTTAFEPILAPLPIVKPPSIWAPAPTTMSASSVGWRLVPLYKLVPPKVTPW